MKDWALVWCGCLLLKALGRSPRQEAEGVIGRQGKSKMIGIVGGDDGV